MSAFQRSPDLRLWRSTILGTFNTFPLELKVVHDNSWIRTLCKCQVPRSGNLWKDEISDLAKGKIQNKQLRFPAMLLDNNAASCWLGCSVLKDWERMAGFMLYFHEIYTQKHCLLCLNSWQTVAAPLIPSPVISNATSQDPKLSNCLERLLGKDFLFFNSAFQHSCLQVLLSFISQYFQAHILMLPIIPRPRCLRKKTVQMWHNQLQLIIQHTEAQNTWLHVFIFKYERNTVNTW